MPTLKSYIDRLTRNLKAKTKSFIGDRKGSSVVTFSLASVPFVMVGTMAVDYAVSVRAKTVMQAAADAAVLAAATSIASGQNDENKRQVALQQFVANLPAKIKKNFVHEPHTTVNLPDKEVTLTASVSNRSYFGKMLAGATKVSVSATAIVQKGTPICLMALNPTVENALRMNGTADVRASGCSVHVNSKHNQALNEDGTGFATADEFCVRGKYQGDGFTPTPKTGCFKEEDPIKKRMADAWATVNTDCTHTGKIIVHKDRTLAPGVYCGGVYVHKATLQLTNGGTYVFRDGPLWISSQGVVRGDHVTMLFYGNSDTRLATQGGADLDISAKTSGPFAGIAIAMHDSVNPDKDNLITGGGYINVDGIIYFPKQHLSVEGNGTIGEHTKQFAIIADTISIQGTGLLSIKITAEYEEFTNYPELPKSSERVVLVK